VLLGNLLKKRETVNYQGVLLAAVSKTPPHSGQKKTEDQRGGAEGGIHHRKKKEVTGNGKDEPKITITCKGEGDTL